MEAVEQGLPEPPRPVPSEVEAPEAQEDMEPADEWTGAEVWEHDGRWWTDFPAPAGFDGEEGTGRLGFGYERTLTEAEQAVIKPSCRKALMNASPAAIAISALPGIRFFAPGGVNLPNLMNLPRPIAMARRAARRRLRQAREHRRPRGWRGRR